MSAGKLRRRVAEAGGSVLAESSSVTPVDILVRVGWIAFSSVERWRQGRVPYLEAAVHVDLGLARSAIELLDEWAREQGLEPVETSPVARTLARSTLRFTESGDPDLERVYRTAWTVPGSATTVEAGESRPSELVVVAPLGDWSCKLCGGTGDLLVMDGGEPVCMTCSDLDHLVFLPRGNAALTRRAKQASGLTAVVIRWSRSRKRYERQGILVEEDALAEAEKMCLADEEVRARRRERDERRRAREDGRLVEALATEIRRLYPGCPPERAAAIAAYAAIRGSGRVGRTEAARSLDPRAIEAAVVASVRHFDTDYDDMLMVGVEREQARAEVRDKVDGVLAEWRAEGTPRPV